MQTSERNSYLITDQINSSENRISAYYWRVFEFRMLKVVRSTRCIIKMCENQFSRWFNCSNAWMLLSEISLIFSSFLFSIFYLLRLEKIPARFNVGLMLFMACFTSYMLRTNISINLIAMVQETNSNNTLPDVSTWWSNEKLSLSMFSLLVWSEISVGQKGAVVHSRRLLLGLFSDFFAWWRDGWTLGRSPCRWYFTLP